MVSLDGAEVVVPRVRPTTRVVTGNGADRIGAAWVTVGLIAVALSVIEGLSRPWPPWTGLALILSPLFVDAFWHYERYRMETGRSTLVPATLLQRGLH